MQMGARWRVGETPHRGVPPLLHTAVQEAEVLYPHADSWTLTWLEGRPVLSLDSVLTIMVNADGQIHTRTQSLITGGSSAALVHGGIRESGLSDDDDDDDWLRA